MTKLKQFLKTTALGRVLLMPYRFWFGLRYLLPDLKYLFTLTFTSREIDNFSYDITPLNTEYLIAFVASITERPVADIRRYVEEIQQDDALRQHLYRATVASHYKYYADPVAKYGRRIGWYAFIRALKPKVVLETGTNKGLGTCIIAAALLRNAKDGTPGYIYTTDIDPVSGELFQAPYNAYGKILFGDSITSLQQLDATVDLFINDSDHSPDYEMREYEVMQSKLAPAAVIIGDNAHCSAKLWEFSQRTQRRFLFFQEQPYQHWHVGAGLGVSYIK